MLSRNVLIIPPQATRFERLDGPLHEGIFTHLQSSTSTEVHRVIQSFTRCRAVYVRRAALGLPGKCQHPGCARNTSCPITTITSTAITLMDANEFSHRVATFMFQQFRYKLCEVTGKTAMRSKPTPPMGIEGSLLRGCKQAVKVCLAAFTRPGEYLPYCTFIINPLLKIPILVYMDWDFGEYTAECKAKKTHDGRNSIQERILRDKWAPLEHGTLRMNTPRTVVDRAGRIMVWILPGALSGELQVTISTTIHNARVITIVL